jgi:hypothetical protein
MNDIAFKKFGVMIDCSRNAVMTVSAFKKMVEILSSFGYNTIRLYTEDTYEVDGEPYFGYLRGRYTKDEIREMDAYAKQYGIELIPCIQTLAHQESLTKIPAYHAITDLDDIFRLVCNFIINIIAKLIDIVRNTIIKRDTHRNGSHVEIFVLDHMYGFKNIISGYNGHRILPLLSDFMHGIENIFMHGMDLKTAFFSNDRHMVYEIAKSHIERTHVSDHDHRKILIQNGLRNIDDVCSAFCAFHTDLSNDTNTVFSCYRNYCFHKYIPPKYLCGQRPQEFSHPLPSFTYPCKKRQALFGTTSYQKTKKLPKNDNSEKK